MAKKIHFRSYFLILFFCGSVFLSSAQDLHFSQFYNAPLNLSPALSGVFEGDQRFIANYRNQWSSVPVPYLTFSGSYDQKLFHRLLPSGLIGWGVVFNYDKAGDANLSWTQIGLNLAYTQQLADEHFLTGGFQLMGGQRAFDPELLHFDDQFNGDIFDETLPTQEVFSNTSSNYIDLSAGINWFFRDEDSRSRFHGGLSYRHLNQPQVGFFTSRGLHLPALLNAYGMTLVQVHKLLDISINMLVRLQGPYKEMIGGAAVKYHLNTAKGNELALLTGLSYRKSDAVVVHFEVFYQNWRAGLSYDINTSPFNVATNRNGGPEISVQYIITKIKPPDTFKACPIF